MPHILSGIKQPVGRRAINYLEATAFPWLTKVTRTRNGRTERLFWQSGGGYDRNIDSGKTLLKMIDYVHLNPVRRGLVERAQGLALVEHGALRGRHRRNSQVVPIPAEWLVGVDG